MRRKRVMEEMGEVELRDRIGGESKERRREE
jgi:hypothetical protein